MISKPNKLIFMKHVADDKFQEIMEMFDPPYKNIVNTEEELIKFYYIKSPSESDGRLKISARYFCVCS
jgi:hypothetical protein